MLPASKSRGVQCFSESNVARLIYAMAFMDAFDFSCSRAVPNSSLQASQLGKTRIGGDASSAQISRSNFSIAGLIRNLTPLRRSELIGRSLLD